MSVVLHASDPHFGTEQAGVTEALLHLVQAQKPDIAALSGDITQCALGLAHYRIWESSHPTAYSD